jgi:A/G-specific adenine glycosylase
MDFLAKNLLKWYEINKRDLPWRQVSDPYKVWVSEIILQQTQVIQGLAYYNRFVNQYPTVKDLAEAPFDAIMLLWQGLGYYSRARNMHEAAKFILKEYNGTFPDEYLKIRQLKGIGDYTAAAIASFSFNLPYAVVDGNVYRFLSRFFGISTPIDSTEGKKYFQKLANELLPHKKAAEYNQAIMEFGALYCRPVNPDCMNCIFQNKCEAFAKNEVKNLPVKSKKVKTKNRYFNYIILTYKGQVYINKRSKNDIWKGLYDFFLIESAEALKSGQVLKNIELKKILNGKKYTLKSVSHEYKHILTHQILYVKFFHIESGTALAYKPLIKVKLNELSSFAFPKVIDKHLKDALLIK